MDYDKSFNEKMRHDNVQMFKSFRIIPKQFTNFRILKF